MRYGVVALALAVWLGAAVSGFLALRDARSRNRIGRPIWLTLYLEPAAFSGKSAVYRRWSVYGSVLFLGLTLMAAILQLAR